MNVIIYHFVEDFMEKRTTFRPEHLSYFEEYVSRQMIAAGGALSPELRKGLILFYGDKAEAEAFVQNDPYVINHIVTDYEIGEWNIVVGSKKDVLSA